MRKSAIIFFISVVMVIVTASQPLLAADMGSFLDGAMNELSNLSPKSYQGQERGYYMGGSASIRIPQETIQPFSFTPPSIKAGCGGIDIVMGGFSYLNFEYLVQKLQSILQSAPAFAFNLALGVLCPDCKNILSELEGIADMINGLNIDSCKASKAITGYAATQLQQVAGFNMSTGTDSAYFKSLRDGASDWQNEYKNWIEAYSGIYDCNALFAGDKKKCKAKQAIVSFRVPLWEQVFNDSDYYEWLIPVFRGYYGDVFENAGEGNMIDAVSGCAQKDQPNIIDAMVFGKYTAKTALTQGDTNCQSVDASAKSLYKQVQTRLTNIVTAMKAGSAIQQADVDLINASRIPVYKLLSLAIVVEKINGDTGAVLSESFIDALAAPIAYDIAFSVLQDLNHFVDSMIKSAQSRAANGETGGDLSYMLSSRSETLLADLHTSQREVDSRWKEFRDRFGDSLKRTVEMQEIINKKMAETKLLNSYQWARGIR